MKEYKIVRIVESGWSSLFFGSAAIPVEKMEGAINVAGKEGWTMIFQVIEKKRFLLFWSREAVLITFGRQRA